MTERTAGAPLPPYEPPADDEDLDDIQRALVKALLPILVRKIRENAAAQAERDPSSHADDRRFDGARPHVVGHRDRV